MRFAKITERLQGLGSDKWAVHIEGKRRRAAGEELIFLSIGEPDFAPPAAIMDVVNERMRAGRTRYSGGRGEPAVRMAIAGYYSKRTRRNIDPDQATFLPGTQSALYAAMITLAGEGDEVLVPDPYYATYEGVIAASGARLVPMRTLPEDAFHLTPAVLEAHISKRSRVLLLNSPGNPTGAVLSKHEVAAIGALCRKHDLWMICDEVYADLVFGGEYHSPFDDPALEERTVVVSSLSKSHAMPGFRCGWAVGPLEFTERLAPISETMLFGSQPFLEDAAAFALGTHFDEVDQMRAAYIARARVVVSGLSNAPAIAARMPEGGMFIMVDVRRTGLSGTEFAMRLLDEEKVVVMPGESFGEGGAGHLRVGLTAKEHELEEACRRISRLSGRIVGMKKLA
jgi:arginine:pyruvate transaminase